MSSAVGETWELGEGDNCRGRRSGSQGEWLWLQLEKALEEGWWRRIRWSEAGVVCAVSGEEQSRGAGRVKVSRGTGKLESDLCELCKPQLACVSFPLHPIWGEHSPSQSCTGSGAQRLICLG